MAGSRSVFSTTADDPGALLAGLLFLAWALLVVSGSWVLIVAPMRVAAAAAADPARIARIEDWWRQSTSASGAATLVFDPAACACDGAAAAIVDSIQAGLGARGAALRVLGDGAQRPPFAPQVLAFDARGRLRYAGPLRPAQFCSGPRPPVEAALFAADSEPLALVLPAECDCQEVPAPAATVRVSSTTPAGRAPP
jgi:hypothetical protein